MAIKQISLMEALEAKSFDLVNLDDSQISVVVTEILSPTTILKVKKQGFYFGAHDGGKLKKKSRLVRGDLYVKFDIIFPKELSIMQKDNLREILED